MSVALSGTLGLAFLALSVIATLTMYRFWGYPYDKERRLSSCPQWKMNIHRAIGFAYIALYVVFMIEMMPRLWEYQVELPARTVAHICLGITIGVILLVKVSILRWFRHFEEWMPALGTLLMLCTFLLVGLSVPFVLKERALASGAIGGGAFGVDSRARVAELLPAAGFEDDADFEALASTRGLREGRRVLLEKCVYCHDLKTAIASARTPSAWRRTVERMAEKPTLGPRITAREQRRVTAYLVAITPDLQRSEKERRKASLERQRAQLAADEALHGPELPDAGVGAGGAAADAGAPPAEPDRSAPRRPEGEPRESRDDGPARRRPRDRTPDESPARDRAPRGFRDAGGADGGAAAIADAGSARKAEPAPDAGPSRAEAAEAAFTRLCSLCHSVDDVHAAPPRSAAEARDLIHRMVDHGLSASERELRLIEEHLVRTFAE